MEFQNFVSLIWLLLGTTLAASGTSYLISKERRHIRPFSENPRTSFTSGSSSSVLPWLAVAALIAIHFLVGLERIDLQGLTHVECYVPGLILPPGMSVPPPRIGLIETIQFHWHSEPHPPGYFLFMWGWTKIFGVTLTAIRFPGLLFGCGSILIAFLIGRRVSQSQWGGVLAACFLALNGHHLHWALMARQYELATLLGLLSTWLWLFLLSNKRENFTTELLYTATIVLGLLSHVLFWLFLGSQMLYTVASRIPGQRLASRPLYFQILSVLLASPMIFHALYTGRGVKSGADPSFAFTQDFVNFGFLFQYDAHLLKDIPFLFEIALTLVALLCLAKFVKDRTLRLWRPTEDQSLPSTLPLVFIMAGYVMIIVGLSREAWRDSISFQLTALVPVVAVIAYLGMKHLRVPAGWPTRGLTQGLSPLPFLAFSTLLLAYIASISQPMAVSRALLVAVPALLITLAIGALALIRSHRVIGAAVLAFLLIAHAYSAVWYRGYSPARDYRGLAEKLIPEMQEDDLIFVRGHDWRTTPLFYHLPNDHHRLVADRYQSMAAEADRIWVVRLDRPEILPEIESSLAGFATNHKVSAYQSDAFLYERVSISDE